MQYSALIGLLAADPGAAFSSQPRLETTFLEAARRGWRKHCLIERIRTLQGRYIHTLLLPCHTVRISIFCSLKIQAFSTTSRIQNLPNVCLS